jgi:hypothetical protein
VRGYTRACVSVGGEGGEGDEGVVVDGMLLAQNKETGKNLR